jgi:DNA polymerase (family 10)
MPKAPPPAPTPPDGETIAAAFEETSRLLELTGDNPHRVRSYASVARILEKLPRPIDEMVADGSLLEVKGIGEGTVGRVKELLGTGRMAALDELRAKVPAGVVELLAVPGLGPKRVRDIWTKLGVVSLVELEYACLENRLRDLDGFGDRLQDGVLKGIGFLRRARGRRLLSTAREAAERVLVRLQRDPEALRLALVGDAHRRTATVEGVHLLATAHDARGLLATFASMPPVAEVVERSASSARVVLDDGTPVRLDVVEEADFALARFLRTGSAAHVAAVVGRLGARGFAVEGDGCSKGRTRVDFPDEPAIYEAAGLAFVPPELREGDDPARPVPEDLVEAGDVRGILHAHTTWSDGRYSILEMATKAREAGFGWFAVCDHSQAAAYAKGLDAKRLAEQGREIDELNASGAAGIPILKGIETDILPDGALDLPAAALAELDVVIGSVHSAMTQSPAVMTERLVRALADPLLHVLGHPTGRLLLGREGYGFDVARVFDACAKHGVALELNANPHRLDLDESLLPEASARGIPIAIDPDAHDLRGIEDVLYGVGVARRAGLRRREVLTALEVEAFRAWTRAKRGLPPPPPLVLPASALPDEDGA